MKNIIFIISLLVFSIGCAQSGYQNKSSQPVNHEAWDQLLQKHVDSQGMVDYKGFIADSTKLNQYLEKLSKNGPNNQNWSRDERLAYWINAYNAFTIQLIIRNYPVNSIKDIAGGIPFVNTPWDIKFIDINGEKLDLNNIEHGIIRKEFSEPRIHFALVCAAVSCPKLLNRAYTADKLNLQLENQTTEFFNNPQKNLITEKEVKLSSLMKWYSGDFKDAAPSIREYVNRYSKKKIGVEQEIGYMDYSWKLNEQ